MYERVAPLLDLVVLGEQAVHRAFRSEVLSLAKEHGDDLCGRQISAALLVQNVEDRLLLIERARARRRRPRQLRRDGFLPAIERRHRQPERGQDRDDAGHRHDVSGGVHESLSSSSGLFSGMPSIEATFFWTSMMASCCFSLVSSRRSRSFSSASGLFVGLRPRF